MVICFQLYFQIKEIFCKKGPYSILRVAACAHIPAYKVSLTLPTNRHINNHINPPPRHTTYLTDYLGTLWTSQDDTENKL